MADFSKPTVGSAYTSFPTEITDAVTAALQQLSVGSHSNIPNGAIQFSLTDNRWKKFDNGSFVDLTSTYAFNAQISATQVSVGDGQKILLGNSNDFEIVHDGANSVIRETGNGALFIQSDDIVRLGKTDGSNNYLEASLAQIILKSGNSEKIKIDSSGAILPDNVNIRFGADADLRLFHDGTNSFIDSHTNDLNIRSLGSAANVQIIAVSDYMARFIKNGAVELYFDNNKKIETLSTGAKITGVLNVNSTSLDSHQAVIEGGVAGQSTSSLALKTGSGANSKVADLSFYSTFVTPTSDQGQRRSADITSGFSTGAWGNEYIAFHIGKGSSTGNDTQLLTDERVRMNKYGIRVSGDSNNSTTDSWDTNSAITTSGSFGGGIAMIDGSAGFVQSLDGLGSNYYLRSATTTSTPETNIKAIANGAVELYHDNNKKIETTSYGVQLENTDTNLIVHYPNNARGGLAALSTQRLALATTTQGDDIVFGFGSNIPITSSNFTERLRIDNGTGNIQIPNDSAKLQLGASQDLELFHDGSNSVIDNLTGGLFIKGGTSNGITLQNRNGNENMAKFLPDGAVELYYDNVRMTQTTAKGFKITGNSSNPINTGWETDSGLVLDGAFAGGLAFKDGSFGGATMFVHVAGTQWALRMAASGGTPENAITADRNGSVRLYHDASEKIRTDTNGVIVTGAVFANSGTNNQVHINPSDGSIEISRNAGGAFIDFKNDLGEDKDARIQEASGGFTMTGNVAATSFSGSGAALTNLPVPVHTVKHVRQTSDFEIATGNTSYGVAGNINMTITAPSSGTFLLFYNYSLNLLSGGTNPGGNKARYRGKVKVNGVDSHFWIAQSETNNNVGTKEAFFTSEGVNGSTYYSANDSINIVLEIRNGDVGTGNKSRLGAGSYLTVFLVKVT